MTPTTVQANQSFQRWLHTKSGRFVVQSLIVLLTLQGWPLQELSRHSRWQLPGSWTWLAPVGTALTQWLGQQRAEAHGNAARIFTIDPSCAGPGDTVLITGNGFGAHGYGVRFL